MAKKIRLDFSKVEERAGWNTRHIPEGLHSMKITAVVDKDANDGTAMWTYALVPESSKYKTRRFPYYCKLQPNQLFKLRDLFVAAGVPVPKKAQLMDPEKVLNKVIAVEVEDDEYNGSIRSQVAGVYSTDILDGDEPEPQEDDEEEGEEDEYEDDGEDAEEEADEEDEEDEEDEDLESLTLAELRKRVKDLGESTAGLKKADLIAILEGDEDEDEEDDEEDEDEDLDEEELYEDDEDEEDEEEEEEPAPRRRPTARKPAPAKAAPARKAAAPAAKRTVKRR